MECFSLNNSEFVFSGFDNMQFLIFALLVCFALARFDPNFPAAQPFPQNYDGNLRIKYGAAYGVVRINGDFSYSYRVQNQPNRHAKFQVTLLNETNFARYNAGQTYYCLNPESCSRITTDPVQGGFNGYRAFNQSVWLVVQNRNFLDDANIRVSFTASGLRPSTSGSSGWTSGFNNGQESAQQEGGHGHH